MKELTVQAKTENLDEVLAFVNKELEAKDCDPGIQIQIDLTVEELFVNIAHYAYQNMIGTATVLVEILNGPTRAEITLMDNGTPYDPLSREDPNLDVPAEERPIGGLGIFLVKENMDHVSYAYKDKKNILTIRKKLS